MFTSRVSNQGRTDVVHRKPSAILSPAADSEVDEKPGAKIMTRRGAPVRDQGPLDQISSAWRGRVAVVRGR